MTAAMAMVAQFPVLPLLFANLALFSGHASILAFEFHRPSPSPTASKLWSNARSAKPKLLLRSTDDDDTDASLSRRFLFRRTISSFAAALVVDKIPSVASAKVVASPSFSAIPSSTPERDALLEAISGKSSDKAVLDAINKLLPLSPLKEDGDTKESYASALDGEWKLLWYNFDDFSPLLKLPSPFRPDSFQYFGTIAEKEVGRGRVAQGLHGGVLNALGSETELWLSSGAAAAAGRPSTLEIYPPFRFQLGELPGSPSPKRTIVESQSDADFRAANARSVEAQLAPKNEYAQLYLENQGSGSLRVSSIVAGDPVIVGDIFVHQKI